MTPEPTYTTRQAAALLGVTQARIRQLAAAWRLGQIRQEQRGPVRLLSEADLAALRERNTQAGRPKRGQ